MTLKFKNNKREHLSSSKKCFENDFIIEKVG